MSKRRVLAFRHMTRDVESELASRFDVKILDSHDERDRKSLLQQLSQFDALCPTVADPIDREMIAACKGSVKIISNFGVGYDNIDLEAARDAGIVVTNTPDVLTEATADLTILLLLMVTRRAGEGERLCRSGHWDGWNPTQLLGSSVAGKTLGLVGFGRIARAVAQRARDGFGMRIRVFDLGALPPAVLDQYGAVQDAGLADLLAASDFVSLHCPSTPETRHLIDENTIGLMQPSAYLINTARGDVVDEQALAKALESRTIAGAGLDVYELEPAIGEGLIGLENVVLLPHLGSATVETRSAMGLRMLNNMAEFFSGNEPLDRVV